MPRAEDFVGLGLFAVRNFLEPQLCARLRALAQTSQRAPATVIRRGESVLDRASRRTGRVDLGSDVKSRVEERLRELVPALESHFDVELSELQEPQLLAYGRGDYFRPHQDNSHDHEEPEDVRERRISAVVFLNSEARRPTEGHYCGGSLAFYRLVPDPTLDTIRTPLTGEEGLLIAFPSDVFHEVSPVTHGERYSLVAWFA